MEARPCFVSSFVLFFLLFFSFIAFALRIAQRESRSLIGDIFLDCVFCGSSRDSLSQAARHNMKIPSALSVFEGIILYQPMHLRTSG